MQDVERQAKRLSLPRPNTAALRSMVIDHLRANKRARRYDKDYSKKWDDVANK